VANSIVCAYLTLSLPLSIVHIIRSRAKYSRLLLVVLDAVSLTTPLMVKACVVILI
jgi:hypothetical protein